MRRVAGALVVFMLVATVAAGVEEEPIRIMGAGTESPYPVLDEWFKAYGKVHPEVELQYKAIGSGGGMQQIAQGMTDFAATEAPMRDDQMRGFKEARHCEILHLPALVRGVVPIYNLPGVNGEMRFTAKALAGIYLGTITKWNDSELQKANPDTKLPANDIVVVYRADGTAISWIWTDYLSRISEGWKEKVGAGIYLKWPVGRGAKGNDGVAAMVEKTANSIGYVELVYAADHKLSRGNVENTAGKFIKADAKSLAAAAAGAAKGLPEDFRGWIGNAAGEEAYPLAGFEWLIVPDKIEDADKRKAIVGFLKWILIEGQKTPAAEGIGRLPPVMVEKEMKVVERIGG